MTPFEKVFFLVMGVLALLYGCLTLYYHVRGFLERRTFWRWNEAFMVLGSLYPIGVGLKFMFFGPLFLRWHMTDFGFPLFISYYYLFERYWRGYKKKYWTDESVTDGQEYLKYIKFRRVSLAIALGLSYAYEIFTEGLYRFFGQFTRKTDKPFMVGRFDPIDMLMYTAGAACGFVLLWVMRRRLVTTISRVQQRQEEVRQAELERAALEREKSRLEQKSKPPQPGLRRKPSKGGRRRR